MQMIKYLILFIIFFVSSIIGRLLSQKYSERLEELEEIRNAFNLFKTKIKFTYETIPEIFEEISKNCRANIAKIFEKSIEYAKENSIAEAWKKSIDETKEQTNLNKEDIRIIKLLSKQLGTTDIEGQISQIEITENFLETQIKQAQEERDKNQKLYQKLGTTIGLVIVILLV